MLQMFIATRMLQPRVQEARQDGRVDELAARAVLDVGRVVKEHTCVGIISEADGVVVVVVGGGGSGGDVHGDTLSVGGKEKPGNQKGN